MALTVSFTTGQFIGAPTDIVFTDTSTGTDAAVTSRIIYLQKYDGTYLVPSGSSTNYIDWPIASNPITISILDSDQSFTITVKWLNVTNVVLYSSTDFGVFNMYARMLNDTLLSGQQANPSLVSATNYYGYRIQLMVAIKDAVTAITDMSDVTNSQQACNRGMYFVNNQSLFF